MKHFLFAAYAFTIGYGVLFYCVGKPAAALTVVMMLGLPLILYGTLAYVASPAIACLVGWYARWSIPISLFLGYPLVLLTSFVFPLGMARGRAEVPVPWLALYHTPAKDEVLASMPESMARSSALFAVCFVAGLVSRYVRPPKPRAAPDLIR